MLALPEITSIEPNKQKYKGDIHNTFILTQVTHA